MIKSQQSDLSTLDAKATASRVLSGSDSIQKMQQGSCSIDPYWADELRKKYGIRCPITGELD